MLSLPLALSDAFSRDAQAGLDTVKDRQAVGANATLEVVQAWFQISLSIRVPRFMKAKGHSSSFQPIPKS